VPNNHALQRTGTALIVLVKSRSVGAVPAVECWSVIQREPLHIVSRVDNFTMMIGGEPHAGWLPPGAAKPLPTPTRQVVLNFTIEFDGSGYLLIVDSDDGLVRGDTWHQSVADAQAQAELWYGVPTSAWKSAEPAAE
jgi:hypothetical protein